MASIPMSIRAHLPRSIFAACRSSKRHPVSVLRHHLRSTSSTSSNSSTATAAANKPKLSWLDLRGSGLSAVERLAIEELLLRHDPLKRCWAIVGVHEPTENRLLNISLPPHDDDWNARRKRAAKADDDVYGHQNEGHNRSCAITMGIGGKPERLIDIQSAKNDGMLVLKRFSGGGTVVVDPSSLWTTFIMRNEALPEVKPYPREIMEWSANAIFGPAFDGLNREILNGFGEGESNKTNGMMSGLASKRRRGRQTLVFEGKSCGISGGSGESLILPPKDEDETIPMQTRQQLSSSLPQFRLRENDYVLGERKSAAMPKALSAEDSYTTRPSYGITIKPTWTTSPCPTNDPITEGIVPTTSFWSASRIITRSTAPIRVCCSDT